MLTPDDRALVPGPAPATTIAPVASSPVRTWALALSAGLAAGLVAWAVGEATLIPEAGFQNKAQKIVVLPEVAGLRNCSISFGALGAAMGLGLGMAGGLIRRSVPRAVMAGAAGLLLAGGIGVAVSRLILPIYYQNSRGGDITYSLMAHAGVWAAAAAATGLAFALGLGGWRGALRVMLGAAGAALFATVIYEFAGGIVFPQALTDRPISLTWETRLLARLLVTVLVAAGVVLCAETTGGGTGASAAKT
jgi:hypothetical protein